MTPSSLRPNFDDRVEVLGSGTSVDELSERFLPFAALHHNLEINSPVSGPMLDRAVTAMQLESTHRTLDIACGNGGLLRRIASRTDHATGIDLSPWSIEASATHLRTHNVRADLILGDAADLPSDAAWEAISCVGAGWIFHGFEGTLRALRRRLLSSGTAVVGDLRKRPGAEATGVLTREDQREIIRALGGRIVSDECSTDSVWEMYGADVLDAATRFWQAHKGIPAADQRQLAARWIAEAQADRIHLDFAITVIRFDT